MSTPPERLMVARGDGTMRSETDAEWWTRQLGSVVATMDRSHLRSSARRLVGLLDAALAGPDLETDGLALARAVLDDCHDAPPCLTLRCVLARSYLAAYGGTDADRR